MLVLPLSKGDIVAAEIIHCNVIQPETLRLHNDKSTPSDDDHLLLISGKWCALQLCHQPNRVSLLLPEKDDGYSLDVVSYA